MNGAEARSDPFGLGMKAYGQGVARSNCPFPSNYFEGRHWLLGWDYGRSRSAARRFSLGLERAQ